MAVGDLIPNGRGQWIIQAPTHCGNGHRLGPNRSLVGTTACSCGHRHHEWYCRECGNVTYGPTLGDQCTVKTGPDER